MEMKQKKTKVVMCVLALGLMVCLAQVSQAAPMGTAFTYQGRLMDANGPADGLYDFQFKLWMDPCEISYPPPVGDTITIYEFDVIDGYFTVELDFNSPSAFNGYARWLEIGVRPGELYDPCEYTILSPRQEVTPTPYAIYAENSGTDNDWMVSGNDMYSVPSGNVGIGTSSPGQKLDVSGNVNYSGELTKLDVADNFAATVRAADFMFGHSTRRGSPGRAIVDGNDNLIFNFEGDWDRTIIGGATTYIEGNVGIGTIQPGYRLEVKSSGYTDGMAVTSSDGQRLFRVRQNSDTSSAIYVFDDNDNVGAAVSSIGPSYFTGGNVGIGTTHPSGVLYTSSKNLEIQGTAPSIVLDDTDGTAQNDFEIVNGGDKVLFRDATAGINVMVLELSGTRNTIVRALEITGGSDLSERFEVSAEGEQVKPGMVVCIDPESPGDLVVSKTTYDRTVAGIVSGAGGVKTGMLMGQKGTEADGEHPVALSGRVYCWADASKSSIEPGDLLTTSDTPGHAMKVADYNKSQGATLGKAMTSLKEGKGLVLVLVSLQ